MRDNVLGAIVVIDVIEDKQEFLLSSKPDLTVLDGQSMYAAMIKVMVPTFPDWNHSVRFVIDCLIDWIEVYVLKEVTLNLTLTLRGSVVESDEH